MLFSSDSIFSPSGTGWQQVDGNLKHVTVSPKGYVWGVSTDDKIYYRQGITNCNVDGSSWLEIPGSLKQISNGRSGVWGVNANDEVFYNVATYGDNGFVGCGWMQVSVFIGRFLRLECTNKIQSCLHVLQRNHRFRSL